MPALDRAWIYHSQMCHFSQAVDGELEVNSVSFILEHTASDGKIYNTKFYSLDAILSFGYSI